MYEGGVVFGLISLRLLRLRYCLLLFYLQFCVQLFPLFIRSLRKLDGNWVQLVVLVAVGTAPPLGVRPVRVIILVIWFSRVYTDVAISVVVGVHFVMIYTIHHAGCYGYRCYCCIVKPFHVLFIALRLILRVIITASFRNIASFANCVVLILTITEIMMIIVTIVRRASGVLFAFCLFSWISNVSPISHPNSGILLAGTAFLPSLIFPSCSSSYS